MKNKIELILLTVFVLCTVPCYTQIRIDTAIINLAISPPTIRIKLRSSDFEFNRISVISLNDSNNTNVINILYKNHPQCASVIIQRHWDTTFQINAIFPFDLKIYSILDTFYLCPLNTSPTYSDSLFLTAAQIIALPISFTYINAEAVDKKVFVKWGVAQQENTNKYIVERANKEQRFVEQAQVPPNTLLQYQFTDEKPLAEDIYYRIKAVNKDGTFIYSKTILVKIGKQQPGIVVAPNPVINKQLHVYINNLVPGGYCLQLFSVEGKLLFSKKLAISNGSSTHLVELPTTISKGNYVVKVLSVNDMNVLQQLIYVE